MNINIDDIKILDEKFVKKLKDLNNTNIKITLDICIDKCNNVYVERLEIKEKMRGESV